MDCYAITKKEWDKALEQLLAFETIYAVLENKYTLDYEVITPDNIGSVIYNKPKPATPLKNFFLPVKENLTSANIGENPVVIIGSPNCDMEGLNILDEIYLDKDFPDPAYRLRREQTIIITADCFTTQEHCHCTSYDITPFSENNADASVAVLENMVYMKVFSKKGEGFIQLISSNCTAEKIDSSVLSEVEAKHKEIVELLDKTNKDLPGYRRTGELINGSEDSVWKKYASTCVSCGACTTICPTCSCFLLIDQPHFEKVRQADACQYPGFMRVAGGEDPLKKLFVRFRNRYMCKYVWKPEKFNSIACTGCGRCIEACIGKINKNEMFLELAK